jgi:hypothetical protein
VREFEDFEEALYLSAVNFRTLGYGDIVLSRRWLRVRCGIAPEVRTLRIRWSGNLEKSIKAQPAERRSLHHLHPPRETQG